MKRATMAALAVALASAGTAHAAPPEARGPYGTHRTIATVDLGLAKSSPEGLQPLVLVDVWSPVGAAGVRPLVLFSHGHCNTKADFANWGTRLASQGFVAVIATRRAAVESHVLHAAGNTGGERVAGWGTASGTCASVSDEKLHIDDLLKLRDWATDASAPAEIRGRVDVTRSGLVGHSQGGALAALTTLAAQDRGHPFRATVLLDPSDAAQMVPPGRPVIDAVASTTTPTAVLASSHSALAPLMPCLPEQLTGVAVAGITCESAPPAIYARLSRTLPRMGLRVVGSTHGESEDPDNDDGQANANPARQELYKRYAIAWLRCHLLGDRGMADWLSGPLSAPDLRSGRMEQIGADAGPVACGATAKPHSRRGTRSRRAHRDR